MRSFEKLSYTDKIKWRIRILWATLLIMLAYMVIVSELGGGDSRMMTDLAQSVSRIIFFGGIVFVVYRIIHNKKLLKDRFLLKEQMLLELDERNQYLHDKSGGIVVDILLLILLFSTVTAALFNMTAFYLSFLLLLSTVLIKTVTYLVFSRKV